MYAVEFQTTIQDGKIEVPLEYRAQLGEQVRVILLAEGEDPTAEAWDMIEHLLEHPIVAKEFRPLSREKIYER